MDRKSYLVAKNVFPPELLHAVSKALGGRSAYVWIPSMRVLKRMERNRYIFERYNEGYSQEEIADELFLSIRTVYNILAKERKRLAKQKSRSERKSRKERSS